MAGLSVALLPTASLADYTIQMSCTFYGQGLPWWQCMSNRYSNSDLELVRNGRKDIYMMYEVVNNWELESGRFTVPESFSIKVQNVADDMVLGIVITDAYGNEVFQDKVSKYGVIFVGN